MASRLPLENSFEMSVDDLLDIPEIKQVLTTSLPISTTASDTNNNFIRGGSCVLEKNQADDRMMSSRSEFDSEGMEVGEEEKPAAKQEQKQEEDEQLAHEMPGSMLGSPIQALAEEVIAPPHPSLPSKKSVLATSHHMKTLNAVEFNELRHKLSAKTAILGNRKRQKEKVRQQKMQIKELEAELARLQNIEAELMMCEQRPIESLRAELKMRKREVADLSVKLAAAAKKEVGMMDMINDELRK